jgi:hypothetical protein
MLLVCYKEASEEQYNRFCDDLMQGQEQQPATEDLRQVLEQIKAPSAAPLPAAEVISLSRKLLLSSASVSFTGCRRG